MGIGVNPLFISSTSIFLTKLIRIMTTDSSSPKQDNSRQKLIAIAAVIIVALLGVNAFLIVNSMNKSKANKELTSQLDESEQLKAELEKQYYEALSELEEMRGSNEELNALIE